MITKIIFNIACFLFLLCMNIPAVQQVNKLKNNPVLQSVLFAGILFLATMEAMLILISLAFLFDIINIFYR